MSLREFNEAHNQEPWQNWATKIVDGLSCQAFAEEAIQDYWYPYEWWNNPNHPCLFNIGGDPYDHSLELDVAYINTDEAVLTFFQEKVTKEFYNFIAQNGVSHFWINFYPSEKRTEQKKYEIAVGAGYKILVLKLDENNRHIYKILKQEQFK